MAGKMIADGVYRVDGTVLEDGTWKQNAGSYLVESQAKLASIPDAEPGDIAYTAGFKNMWQLDTDGSTWVSL